MGGECKVLLFGPDVVVLQWLVALADAGVGMGVVTAGGDRVMVVVEGSTCLSHKPSLIIVGDPIPDSL
jgi:hypothetical protein